MGPQLSFVRPEAAGAIRRWSEPAAAAGLVMLTGGFGIRWAGQGGALGWIVLAAAALALFWLRAALLGALAARPVTGAGLVVLREGEGGYMGPHDAALAIPATAEGADHLPEALTALPGFSDLAAVGMLQRGRVGRHVIWERPGLRLLH